MANYHIKKPSALISSVEVYHAGGNQWSDDYSERKIYTSKAKADAMLPNPDGTNGGFKNATVIKE
tara:strand:- start:1912 stop:2106 length:195 start_codon:yes stop_codon:yes gene_type:complete